MIKPCCLSLLVMACMLGACAEHPSPGHQVFISEGYSNKIVDGYWLYLPRNHQQDKRWPVILFLQGSAGTSPDPATSKDAGPVIYALKNSKKEDKHLVSDTFIIINPHMIMGREEKRQWFQYPKTLNDIVNEVVSKYSGDADRIYLTGLSLGGHGSWGLAKIFPRKFAAIVPIAGRINCENYCERLVGVPKWIIHNTQDSNVGFDYSLKTVTYLEDTLQESFLKIPTVELTQDQLHSNMIFSSVDKQGHDAWSDAYKSTSLYTWLLTKRRNKTDNPQHVQ